MRQHYVDYVDYSRGRIFARKSAQSAMLNRMYNILRAISLRFDEEAAVNLHTSHTLFAVLSKNEFSDQGESAH